VKEMDLEKIMREMLGVINDAGINKQLLLVKQRTFREKSENTKIIKPVKMEEELYTGILISKSTIIKDIFPEIMLGANGYLKSSSGDEWHEKKGAWIISTVKGIYWSEKSFDNSQDMAEGQHAFIMKIGNKAVEKYMISHGKEKLYVASQEMLRL